MALLDFRYRSAINAVITAAFIALYFLLGDWFGRIIILASVLLFVLASVYGGVWVAIQIVKDIFGNRRRRL
jgi:hypothetical protein